MRKLLMLIAAMIICNAYGGTAVYWIVDNNYKLPNAITTCSANGNITTPAIPQKDGFRFIGWKRDTNVPSIVSLGGTDSTPNERINNREWTLTNSSHNITITGEARCSSTTGTATTATTCGTRNSNPATTANVNGSTLSTASDEQRCWCRMTKFGEIDVPNMDWIYYSDFTSYNPTYTCATSCAYVCGTWAKTVYSGQNGKIYEKFRRCILGFD